ncbi:unnamed protein product [Cochlearia groenlandica]
MGMGRTISKLRKATKRFALAAWCRSLSLLHPTPHSSQASTSITKQDYPSPPHENEDTIDKTNSTHLTSTILCAICLEPMSHRDDAMFTGHCSHSFHYSCIASNVRHGSVTCPVCRAHWTHLPSLDGSISQVLDDSMTTFRVHRRSFLGSARYNDDEPIDSIIYPCLGFSLIPPTVVFPNLVSYDPCFLQPLHLHQGAYSPSVLPLRNAYLSLKLINPQPIDLVLVSSPSEPHSLLLKQAMILVISSLRPVDRLAIVTYSCVASPLRRMTSCGKRAALLVVEKLYYMGQRDSSQGILKGIKVLKDRSYKNPRCSIVHISTSPIRLYYPNSVMHMGFMLHSFGIETWDGFVMHKLKEFLEKVLRGGVASDIQLRIGRERKIVKVGDLRGCQEKRVLLDLALNVDVRLCYSYVEGDIGDECIRRRGEMVLRFGGDTDDCVRDNIGFDYMNINDVRGSISSETWEYHHNPFMDRRWAKRLHEPINL